MSNEGDYSATSEQSRNHHRAAQNPAPPTDLYKWSGDQKLHKQSDAQCRTPLINSLTNQDWYKWSNTESRKSCDHLPDLKIEQNKESRIATLSDTKAPAEEKLKAAQALAKEGVTNFNIVDQNGKERHVRLELEQCGNKQLLHMFGADDRGREHVLLRAVCNADGTYSHENSKHGGHVSFYGSWWTTNMRNASHIATPTASENMEYNSARSENMGDRMRQLYRCEAPPGSDPNMFNNQNIDNVSDQDQGMLNSMFDRAAANAHGNGDAVYFKAGMDIDCDGSKRARQIDPCGQTQTSLRYRNGESVNAENINYIVLPAGQYKKLGIKLGDIAAVRYNGHVAFAIFADVGPRHKLGEGSMALASALGINNSPTRGGIKGAHVEYLVFPGSGNGTPGDRSQHQSSGTQRLQHAAHMSGNEADAA